MRSKPIIACYTSIAALVAAAWTLAFIKDIVSGSWLIFLSGSQSFLFWLVVVDGIALLAGLKKKSGFEVDDRQDD